MTRRFFITGTDTDVGKTVVTRALARAFIRAGLRVRALKPVESGAAREDRTVEPADAVALLRAAGAGSNWRDGCICALNEPVSPHLAAARQGVRIEEALVHNLLQVHADADIVLAEGAGGFLVPLNDGLLYGDLMARSGYELIIVAANRLGAINATLLTIEAARRREMTIAGVILNGTPAADFGNAQAIVHHGGVSLLGCFPTVIDPGADDADDRLAALAEEHIDLQKLKR